MLSHEIRAIFAAAPKILPSWRFTKTPRDGHEEETRRVRVYEVTRVQQIGKQSWGCGAERVGSAAHRKQPEVEGS